MVPSGDQSSWTSRAMRMRSLADSPGWQLLFDLMRRLAQTYWPINVRLVAWFDG